MYDLFSRRNNAKSDNIDIFIYDDFPETFRNQFYLIINDVVKQMKSENSEWNIVWKKICEGFSREKGLKNIQYSDYNDINTKMALEYMYDSYI